MGNKQNYKELFGIKKDLIGKSNEVLLMKGKTALTNDRIIFYAEEEFKDFHSFRICLRDIKELEEEN